MSYLYLHLFIALYEWMQYLVEMKGEAANDGFIPMLIKELSEFSL